MEKVMNGFKKFWWYLPDYFSKWRLFPRAFITTYMVILVQVVYWFMGLDDPTTQQMGLVSVVVTAGGAWFGLYLREPLVTNFPPNDQNRASEGHDDFDENEGFDEHDDNRPVRYRPRRQNENPNSFGR